MTRIPRLTPGQVSLLRCDVNTGNVFRTDGELYRQTGDIFQTFDSIAAAEECISIMLAANTDMEFVVYGHDGQAILRWNKFGKKTFS